MPVSDGRGNATQLGHEAGLSSPSVRRVGRPQTSAPWNDRKVRYICVSTTGAIRRKSRATQILLSLSSWMAPCLDRRKPPRVTTRYL